jgi:hypothetical protein
MKTASARVRAATGTALVTLAVLTGCVTAPAPAGKPAMRVTSPANGATVKAPVKVEVDISAFTLVAANQAVRSGEGHLHFFIDVPAPSVPVGRAVPLDQATVYVHAGKEPFTVRELALPPGQHTITVVAADAAHVVLAQPEPVSIQVNVQ